MAHPISYAMDKIEGGKATPCNKECKNFRFGHLENACVLSDVYSVRQGQPCYIFEQQDQGEK